LAYLPPISYLPCQVQLLSKEAWSSAMRTIRIPCLSPLNSPSTSPSQIPKCWPAKAHTVPTDLLTTSLPPTSDLPCYQRLTQSPHVLTVQITPVSSAHCALIVL